MKITQINPTPSVLKFKNKEEFSNRVVQEVLNICTKNSEFSSQNKKNLLIKKYEEDLKNKEQKLDSLLEKSKYLKNDLIDKIKKISDRNIIYRDKLLRTLEEKDVINESN